MIRLAWLIGLFLATTPAAGQEYKPVDQESSVRFKIKNFGIQVEGSFHGLSGKIRFDPQQPDQSEFDVSVDALTLETGIKLRNNHIKKKEYLDVESFPRIAFKSTGMKSGDQPHTWLVTGNLTMKGIARSLSIPFTTEQPLSGVMTFTGEFVINRRDFGVGGNSLSMADKLTVFIKVLAAPTR